MSAAFVDPIGPPIVRESSVDLSKIIHAKLDTLHICGNLECRTVSNVAESCPSCTSATTKLAPMLEAEKAERYDLAHDIAVDSCKSDIQGFCVSEQEEGQFGATLWWDTGCQMLEGERLFVERAVRYLDMVGELKHHPVMSKWVRWEEAQ